MGSDPLVKVKAATAVEVCARFPARREAKALLENGMGPWQFLEALAAKKFYVDAIDFLAHALPPREGVWWGCLCFQHACGDKMPPPDKAAAKAAVQWVLQPTDSVRDTAKIQAEAAGPASVSGVLAMAAYQAGSGLPSPDGPPAAVPPFASAKSVANAVKLACLKSGPAGIVQAQRSYVELGVGVAAGRFM